MDHLDDLPFEQLRDKISNQPSNLPLPFTYFIDDLKRQGFMVGVDHYLHLQTILNRFAGTLEPENLKTLLAPVFAVNRKQQTQFYRTFDRYFRFQSLSKKQADHRAGKENAQASQKDSAPVLIPQHLFLIAALLWILLIGLIAYQLHEPYRVVKPPPEIIEIPPLPKPGEAPREPNLKVTYPVKTVPPPPPSWFQRYAHTLRWPLGAAPLLILIFYIGRRSNRQRLAITREHSQKPPDVWPIRHIIPAPSFLKTRPFYNATRKMRRRLAGNQVKLDVDDSISASIANSGFPTLKYVPVTRPPEYLFLIDRTGFEEHYAAFADTLIKTLKKEEVFAVRFYYSGDPLVCMDEEGVRISIANLQNRFARHRLILVGDGAALLDPFTGKRTSLVKTLRYWDERAILTPLAPANWGMREVVLAKNFILLPATVNGLEALTDYFETPVQPVLKTWVQADNSSRPPPETERDIDVLQRYLNDADTFQWLCACAVYPELNWGLTLHLGLLSEERFTEANLLKLIRLPWFRQGVMPDDLRLRLIEHLEETHLQNIRKSVCRVLESDPPPQESAAWDVYQLNLAIHRWLSAAQDAEKRKRLKALKHTVKSRNMAQIVNDHTMLRLLEAAPKSPLAFVLPKSFHRLFFKNGIALFGLRTWVLTALALLVSLALFIGMPKPVVQEEITTQSLTLEFAHIDAGKFMMGSAIDPQAFAKQYGGKAEYYEDEQPRHQVILTKGFYMQTTEVTQGQWQAVMGENPSEFKNCGDDCPVEQVSWNDAQEFIRRLNKREGKAIYRLPTEAEWEYACRAGTATAIYTGDIEIIGLNNSPSLDPIAWYGGNSCVSYDGGYDCSKWSDKQYPCDQCGTHPTGKKQPNAWGLYDMLGNVWEWCHDRYGEYKNETVTDPTGPPSGSARVVRGGSWGHYARYCRSAYRYHAPPEYRGNGVGVRLVRSLP